MKTVSIYDHSAEDLDHLAARTGRSKEYIASALIREGARMVKAGKIAIRHAGEDNPAEPPIPAARKAESRAPGTTFCGAYVDEELHEALKELANSQHRTLADQCRAIYEDALAGRIEVPAAR